MKSSPFHHPIYFADTLHQYLILSDIDLSIKQPKPHIKVMTFSLPATYPSLSPPTYSYSAPFLGPRLLCLDITAWILWSRVVQNYQSRISTSEVHLCPGKKPCCRLSWSLCIRKTLARIYSSSGLRRSTAKTKQ